MKKIVYQHYRVPRQAIAGDEPRKGEPSSSQLVGYGRDKKWKLEALSSPPFERGGKTVCKILDDDGSLILARESTCSFADNFSYRLGRLIAYGRAIAAWEKIESRKIDPEEVVGEIAIMKHKYETEGVMK